MGQAKSQVTRGATAPAYDQNADSDELRGEIRHTRREMDETLDALGERLHPRHLLDDVLDWFRSADSNQQSAARDAGGRVLDTLKDNPIPTALIGAGIAWLIADSRSSSTYRAEPHYLGPYDDDAMYDDGLRQHAGSVVDARTGEPYDESYGADWHSEQTAAGGGDGGPGMMAKAKDKLSGAASSVGKGVSGAAKSAGDTVSGAASSVGNAASRAAGAVSGGAGRVRQGASHLGGRTRSGFSSAGRGLSQRGSSFGHQTRQGYAASRDALWEAAEDYPLAVGAAAMGLGMILGLVVPRTRTEDELMGEMSDELISQGQEAGQDLLDRGKEVVQKTASAAQGQAAEEGLSGSDLSSKVQAVASDVVNAAQKSMKEQGIAPSDVKEKAKHVAQEATSTAKGETQRHAKEVKQS